MSVDSDFSGCFKLVMIVAAVVAVFAWVFIQSGTLELQYENVIRNGMPYQRTIYLFHWERIGIYLKSIPSRIKRIFYKDTTIPGR